MSQAAAAMMMNPALVQQEMPVSASRTARAGASTQSDNLQESSQGRSNSAEDPIVRSTPKLFKDVLEKKLPAASQQNSDSSENTGEVKTERKKSKPSIQDFSNFALFSMNPSVVQNERKTTAQVSLQGGLSGRPSGKDSVQSTLSSSQVQGQSRILQQVGSKESQGKEARWHSQPTQVSQMPQMHQVPQSSSPVKDKDAKGQVKTGKGVVETQTQTKQGAETDAPLTTQKNPSSKTPETASNIPVVGLGNPNLNSQINQERKSKIDSQSQSGIKSREESPSRSEEIPVQQEGKTAKKADKNKTPSQLPDSQDNGGQQQVRADGIQSVVPSQSDNKQVNVVSARPDSMTNAVSSTENVQIPQSPGRQVAETIREQLAMPAPQSEIQMTLNPPELGKIRISFQQNNQEITGLLEVEKLRTRADLQKELPQVLLSLQNAGVQIRRLDVVMQNPNDNPSPDQQFGNQAFSDPFMNKSDHYYASDSHQDTGHSGSERSVRDFQSTQTPDNADQSNSFIREDAINVYL